MAIFIIIVFLLLCAVVKLTEYNNRTKFYDGIKRRHEEEHKRLGIPPGSDGTLAENIVKCPKCAEIDKRIWDDHFIRQNPTYREPEPLDVEGILNNL